MSKSQTYRGEYFVYSSGGFALTFRSGILSSLDSFPELRGILVFFFFFFSHNISEEQYE